MLQERGRELSRQKLADEQHAQNGAGPSPKRGTKTAHGTQQKDGANAMPEAKTPEMTWAKQGNVKQNATRQSRQAEHLSQAQAGDLHDLSKSAGKLHLGKAPS